MSPQTDDPTDSAPARLRIEGLAKAFGGLQAVDGLSFQAQPGEIVGLIGPNGAGKTTVLELVSGTLRPDRGSISLDGTDVTGWRPHRIVEAGIARTFQTPRPIRGQSVAANVALAGVPNRLFGRRRRHDFPAIQRLCARTGLCALLGHAATEPPETPDPSRGTEELAPCACWRTSPEVLPQAGLRQLEVARALATEPRVMLLDEPFAGLEPPEIKRLSRLFQGLGEEGRTLIIVDHDMQSVMRLVDRAVVVHFGRKLAEGSPEELARDSRVQEAYLSGSDLDLIH